LHNARSKQNVKNKKGVKMIERKLTLEELLSEGDDEDKALHRLWKHNKEAQVRKRHSKVRKLRKDSTTKKAWRTYKFRTPKIKRSRKSYSVEPQPRPRIVVSKISKETKLKAIALAKKYDKVLLDLEYRRKQLQRR